MWALKTGRMDSGVFEAWLCCDELANFSPLAGLFSDPAKLQQTATGKLLSSTVIYGSPRKWNWKFWSRGHSFRVSTSHLCISTGVGGDSGPLEPCLNLKCTLFLLVLASPPPISFETRS